MAEKRKRIFIAFAIEDEVYRNFLKGQANLKASPFDFVDMSVKEPWDAQWKTNCRTRIRGCDGVIALISKNTAKAMGELWEIQCAFEEDVPTMLMWVNDERPKLPALLDGKRIYLWNWNNLVSFIEGL